MAEFLIGLNVGLVAGAILGAAGVVALVNYAPDAVRAMLNMRRG